MTPAAASLVDFSGPGFHFLYPVAWQAEESPPGETCCVTVQPDEESTAFWSVTRLDDRPTPQQAVRSVVRALQEEYEELDSYPVRERIAGRDAAGSDIEFVCLELTNSAFVRAVRTRAFTLVVFWQATDTELEVFQEQFMAMTRSLAIENDAVADD